MEREGSSLTKYFLLISLFSETKDWIIFLAMQSLISQHSVWLLDVWLKQELTSSVKLLKLKIKEGGLLLSLVIFLF